MKLFKKATIANIVQIALLSTASNIALAADKKAEDDGKLERITVTALKRTQSIQDVPVSIATLSGEKFENMFSSGDDVLALATKVPGLYAESSNGRVAPRFYMRGLGNTDFDLAASQPVSIIMDDVVMENVVLKSFPLFDVDQVEVIRGPQGTLFGRNTTAGIIKFTSRKPTDDFEAYVRAGVGSYGLQNFEGAVGGGLTEDLTARLSVLNQSKDDWIENGFTGEKDAMGGHSDQAVRLQVGYNPTDALDILFNYHTRTLEGTSSIFRANVLTQGKSGLNSNYDRDKVYYDKGDNNPQEYDNSGWSVNVTYDLGAITLTSITAMEMADGRSLGDIDGGVLRNADGSTPSDVDYVEYQDDFNNDLISYPGFIPFDAITEDQLKDLEQFTQEIRFSSNTTNPLSWQTGVYFFDSSFSVTSIDGFFGATEVFHENTTWAVFGQTTYQLSDELSVIGGLRYTKDKKSLSVGKQNEDGFAVIIGAASIQDYDDVSVSDGQWSWEGMANYRVSEDVSLYARISNGFRAQSIQGRDIAFEGMPSTAKAETIMSYEAGFKSDLIDNTLRLNGAVFQYTIDDIQLTAVGGNGNNIGLTNAGQGTGQGFEVDAEYRVTENLVVTAGYSLNKTELKDKSLRIATCGSGACTPTDEIDPENGGAIVHGNPFPNAPESIFTATGRYTVPMGNEGEVFFYGDYAYQGKTNLFIYETKEHVTDGQFELGLRAGYINYDMDFEIAVFGRNITDEDNLKAGIDFNNNTGVVNEPAVWGIEFKKNFY
ncbi:TonB-dependent receptor [Psychrosphaera sp. B3R10]|uniref:TonB-dependent receptor n=1 Tax=unclassified Psychrosphaera TaxID=2641570 RepID=UPI001C088152|nr:MULTISPECIES: TonB-dependent receptor [unclassified Psychrosphaera]MBU2882175.1 TonB-dependent receptor [Psychrosphaera sp. I2R16]MBU2988856.1 TonB-dependent receptor [Psychrosphaera sp. B3R10]MDO6717875.1 TonB-dependent receptor [Psychrosphaera sp. 1_MG-2023]